MTYHFDDMTLAAMTDGAPHLVREAVRRVWDLAAEFDAEDGYVPELAAYQRPVSRGDRIRREIALALLGMSLAEAVNAASCEARHDSD